MRNYVYGRLGRWCRSIRMLCWLWLLTNFYAWLLFLWLGVTALASIVSVVFIESRNELWI